MKINVKFIENDGLGFFTAKTQLSIKQQQVSLFKFFVLQKGVGAKKLTVLVHKGGCIGHSWASVLRRLTPASAFQHP
jgi:hypothetical protein